LQTSDDRHAEFIHGRSWEYKPLVLEVAFQESVNPATVDHRVMVDPVAD
jgi:hypothetical protein